MRALNNVRNGIGDLRLTVPVVAQPVGLIGYDQVPGPEQRKLVALGELVGANEDLRLAPGCQESVLALRIEKRRWDDELLVQLLLPLLPQAGGCDDEDVALALRPVLGDDDARFDGLTEAHLVGQDDALQERCLQRVQGGIDLVRLRLDLGVEKKPRDLADMVAGVAAH